MKALRLNNCLNCPRDRLYTSAKLTSVEYPCESSIYAPLIAVVFATSVADAVPPVTGGTVHSVVRELFGIYSRQQT